jgi:hypothetical protein
MMIWIARTLYEDPDTGERLEEPFELFLQRVREEYPRAHIYIRPDYFRHIEVHCWDDEGGDDRARSVERDLALLAEETLIDWARSVSRDKPDEES